jgi:hypothetical protein
MNAPRKSGKERLAASRREPKRAAAGAREDDERRETLILFAIAILLVANIVVYVCQHHFGLTSQNDWKPRSEVSARVIVD